MHSSEYQTKSQTIPIDMIMDAFGILLDNNMSFRIEGINEHENSLIVQITINPKLPLHKQVLENIRAIITDYNWYRHSSNNDHVGYIN